MEASEQHSRRIIFRPSYLRYTPIVAHPILRVLFNRMKVERMNWVRLGERSGVSFRAIQHWFQRSTAKVPNIPNVCNLDACLQALGLRLIVVPLEWFPDTCTMMDTKAIQIALERARTLKQ